MQLERKMQRDARLEFIPKRYAQSPYCRKKLNFLANEIEGIKL